MCHIRIAILPAASPLSTTLAQPALAQDAGSFAQKFANSLTASPTENLSVTGGFYAPAYSSVSMSHDRLRVDFSVALSVHNASETRPLVVKRLAYFDTAGKTVDRRGRSARTSRDALRPAQQEQS